MVCCRLRQRSFGSGAMGHGRKWVCLYLRYRCTISPADTLYASYYRGRSTSVHFLSISARASPHPHATCSTIVMRDQLLGDVQLRGDLIAWTTFSGRIRNIRVTNWRSGVLIWVRASHNDISYRPNALLQSYVYSGEAHFSIVDAHHLLVVEQYRAPWIYEVNPSASFLEGTLSGQDTTSHLCELQLPKLLPGYSFDIYWMTGEPSSSSPRSDDCKPVFSQDPHNAVLALHCRTRIEQHVRPRIPQPESAHLLFIPVSTIIQWTSHAHLTRPGPPLSVPWEEWGPTGTRWIPLRGPGFFRGFNACGSRVAICFPDNPNVIRRSTGSINAFDVIMFDVHPGANQPLHR